MANFKRIYGYEPEVDLYETLLSVSNGKMPKVAVAATSDLNIPVLKYLEPLAEESEYLSLVSIKQLNHLGKYGVSCPEVRSNCYDLSDESSKGYEEFNEELDSTLQDFDLIVTVGERYDGNYYNNQMPIIEYEDIPVVHLIECINIEDLEEACWEYDNTIAIPRLFVDEVTGVHAEIDFVNYEEYFNFLCSMLIKNALEGMQKEIREKRGWGNNVQLNLSFFQITDKIIMEAYRQMKPKLVTLLV